MKIILLLLIFTVVFSIHLHDPQFGQDYKESEEIINVLSNMKTKKMTNKSFKEKLKKIDQILYKLLNGLKKPEKKRVQKIPKVKKHLPLLSKKLKHVKNV